MGSRQADSVSEPGAGSDDSSQLADTRVGHALRGVVLELVLELRARGADVLPRLGHLLVAVSQFLLPLARRMAVLLGGPLWQHVFVRLPEKVHEGFEDGLRLLTESDYGLKGSWCFSPRGGLLGGEVSQLVAFPVR